MQPVPFIELMSEIKCALVNVDRSGRRSRKSIRTTRNIRLRNQRQQFLRSWIGYAGTLCRSQHVSVQGESLSLPQPFIAEKEKSVVLPDRTTNVSTKVASFEG